MFQVAKGGRWRCFGSGQADIEIAERISDRAGPEIEQLARILTWGADEHVICALAAGWWLFCGRRGAQHRTDSNHVLLTTVTVTLLPHLLKSIFDQRRPDRLMVRGHLHGVPFSGKPLDAFPSGHAIHVGALASAAMVLRPAKRDLAWSIGLGLVLTRIVLLAHWTSDVIAGLAIGAAVERLLRHWTGFRSSRRGLSNTGNACKQIGGADHKNISAAGRLRGATPRPRN